MALRAPILYFTLSIAIPLLSILVAAVLSNWFSLVDNALSDLGHATRSSVAPLFNTGLSLGGLMIAIGGVKYLGSVSRKLSILMCATGYSLILVAVFDEVYGALHFYVSVLFFVLLFITAVYYAIALSRNRRLQLATIALLTAGLVSWIFHFTLKLPKGAAIPELISLLAALPAYVHAYDKACSR